ncbi:MAG: hypothetical protein R2911_24330 [Caldilineaceae bacterium]
MNREDHARYQVFGYEFVNGIYTPLSPAENGRIYSNVNRVWIGPNAQQNGFEVIDAHTDQPIQPQTVIDHDRRRRPRRTSRSRLGCGPRLFAVARRINYRLR